MEKRNSRTWLTLDLLNKEVEELNQSYEMNPENFPRELADVAIFLLTIANVEGIDLEAEIKEKIARNQLKYPPKNFDGRYEYDEAIAQSRSEWIEDKGEKWFYE